jgi:hypothetical protein
VAGQQTPFLDQKKLVPKGLEWSREVTSRRGGTIAFRVTSRGPFAVTVVADKAFQAIKSGNRSAMTKEDILLTVDSQNPVLDGKVTMPSGSSWFILKNDSDQDAEFQLQCFEAR